MAQPSDILNWLERHPGASPAQIQDALGVPRTTMNRWVQQLIRSGDIITVGRGPAVRHFPSDLRAYLELPLSRRPEAAYQEGRVSSELPRFTPTQLGKLNNAAPGRGSTSEQTAMAVRKRLMVELSYASSRLEGNTYDRIETEALIEYGQEAKGKTAEESRMILNHRDAIAYLLDHINDIQIDRRTIIDIHALVSNGLLAQPLDEGQIRDRPVSIGSSAYKPLDNRYQIAEALDVLLSTINAEAEPFNQSLMLMTGIAYLQPFIDCNKRTARIMANLPLIKHGLPPLSFVTVEASGYLRGLLAYYELGATQIIASTFLDGYVECANQYHLAVSHPPKSQEQQAFELRYKRFTNSYVKRVVLGEQDTLEPLPETIPLEDRERLQAHLKELLSALHPGQAVVYGVSAEAVQRYLVSHQESSEPASDDVDFCPR